MAGRDQEFVAFLDARGPALWRMASLLELEPDDAEALLVTSLSDVRQRWSALTREGNAEPATRLEIAARYVASERRAGMLDAAMQVPGPVGTSRAALFSLTPRQRTLLVLTTYAGADIDEAAKVVGASRDEVPALIAQADEAFRGNLAESGAPLLTLLDGAALHEVPTQLNASVLAAAPRHRRRLMATAGGVAVVLVGALVLSPWGRGSDASDDPAAAGDSGVPAVVDLPTDPPALTEAPIESASAALVVDDVPVVLDAATGEVRAVFDDSSDLAPMPIDRGNHGTVRQNWSQAVLSPDGTRLLLVRPRPWSASMPGRPTGSGTGELVVVDIASGDATVVDELNPSPRATGVAGIAQPRLAWAPDSASFACACSGTLSLGLFDDDGLGAVNHTARMAHAVAWGPEGVAVADRRGGWSYTDQAAAETSPFIYSTGLAVTRTDPTMYLEVSPLTIYALGADSEPDGGHCTLWDADFTYPMAVLPMAERGGTLCTPMTVQAGRSGFVLVLPGVGSEADERPFDVVAIDRDGSNTVIGTVPRETTAASFAAELVG